MPTVSGKWVWNDFLNLTEFFTSGTGESITNVNCTVDGKNYHTIVVDSYGNRMPNYITLNGDDPITICNSRDTNTSVPIFAEYKNIDFGEEAQEVSQDFYNGLTANATKQEEPVVPTTTKTVSSDNLARFKQKCDETYATIGNIPTVSTELVNLGTLSTSGTLTTDQVTQIGTTTIGVTARASVNGVTRFYERVNISGTTATLVSADDDALHVLTVNLSTRAYTLSDVALGGGGGGGTKYQHNITVENASFAASDIFFSMVTDDAEAYTDDGEIAKALYNLGFRHLTEALQATGVYDSLTNLVVAVCNGQSDSGSITFVLVNPSNSSALVQKSGSVNVVSDIVIEL